MEEENSFIGTDYDKLRFPLSEIRKHRFDEKELFNYEDYFFDKTGDFIFHKNLFKKEKYKTTNKKHKEGSKTIRLEYEEYWNKYYFDSDFQRMGFDYDATDYFDDIIVSGFQPYDYLYNGILFYNGEIVSKFIWVLSSFWGSCENPLTSKNRCIVENIKYTDTIKKEFSDTKYAIADKNGDLISDWFDFFSHSNDWIDDKYILAEKNGKYGIVDYNGKTIVPFNYDWGNWDYEYDSRYERLRINKNNDCDNKYIGLFAWTGELVIDVKFKELCIKSAFYNSWFENENQKEIAKQYDFVLLEDYNGNFYYWSFKLGLIKTHKLYLLNNQYPSSDYDFKKYFEVIRQKIWYTFLNNK